MKVYWVAVTEIFPDSLVTLTGLCVARCRYVTPILCDPAPSDYRSRWYGQYDRCAQHVYS